jgi:TfoX/Sxy family transcriptional regulator of competence genes
MDDALVTFLLDQLDDPSVTARRMFGGHGIYRGPHMFGIVYDGDVYLKLAPGYDAPSEREPFRPRPTQTLWSYRLLSAEELEDRAALQALAQLVLGERAHR